ncbi:hypothetical protein [Shewanella aestuarii]|uniref:Uncharacterized protein n=1 Tax=Shewanella aestuarii TaxID=1028752 RepID=A0A6G9QGP8_9GAMM|nr:hypothetical protein [Shewanella aestuarii]QIR13568.1 hypothetical protein HBH39_02795 [Shewanella aestuarii]
MTSLLSKLELTAKPQQPTDKLTQRRNKLLERLTTQKEIIRCLLNNEVFSAFREVSKLDELTGQSIKEKVPRRVKPWFYKIQDQYFLEVRYGAKPLELAKNKHAIAVGDESRLNEVLDVVIDAVKAGELDTQLAAIRRVGAK